MGGVCCNSKGNDIHRSVHSRNQNDMRRAHTEPNEEFHQRITTNNLLSEENIIDKVNKENVKILHPDISDSQPEIEFYQEEEKLELKYSQSCSKNWSVNNKSTTTNINQLKLDGLENINQNESLKSILNFNPDDVIGKKGLTNRTKKSWATSNTILKTPHGFEAINIRRPLQYLVDKPGRLKNKRQQSEFQKLRFSEDLIKIMHKHHLSSGDTKLAGLDSHQLKALENCKDEEELIKEMSNFMDEPREIISMINSVNRESPYINKIMQSIQLSTLSTNPKKNMKSKRNPFDSANLPEYEDDMINIEHKDDQNYDNSGIYDEELMLDERSEGGGVGPNEWMYIDCDPIPSNLMLSFEEALQRQKEILDKSSKVCRNIMPVWDSRAHSKIKFYKKGDIDANETSKMFKRLKLEFDYELKKLDELSESPWIIDKYIKQNKVIHGKIGSSISVACAIISIANYDSQFKQSVIGNLIYPNKNEMPLYNSSGVYGIKVRFNGAQRLVKIDDYVPTINENEALLWTCENNFATQLLEKALIKLYGGSYTIMDTNPSIEMHHFIGWIPETVKFSDVNNKDNLWIRMKQNFKEGNIILSINYNPEENQSENRRRRSKLKSEDSNLLAVIDIREFKDHKLIKWVNPSGGFTSFNIYKPNETHSLTGELIEPVKLLAGTTRKMESTFWLNWDDVLQKYNQINLWWNPSIYPFKKRVHSYWKNVYSPPEDYPNLSGKFLDEKYSMEYCPQFVFTIPPHKDDFEVRIFLQRHMKSFYGEKDSRYLSFKLFSYEGNRIIYPEDNLRSFSYSTRELCSDVFIFENSTQDESYVLAILKGDNLDDTDEVQFTLDVLSFIDIEVKELPEPVIEESYELRGKINDTPQFKITVKETVRLQIKAECNNNRIMVALLDDIKALKSSYKGVVKDRNPGCYNDWFSWLELKLKEGEYIVLICTEQAPIPDDFRILFNLMEDPKIVYSEDLIVKAINS